MTEPYPAPLLAEKMDRDALDEMLRKWAGKFGVREKKPRTPPPPPEDERDDEREQVMSENAIQIYCRQFWDWGE